MGKVFELVVGNGSKISFRKTCNYDNLSLKNCYLDIVWHNEGERCKGESVFGKASLQLDYLLNKHLETE